MTKINQALLKDFLNELYPVGKTEIFLDNEDHSNYMGFTWQRDAIGRAIVGIDSNDTDFNAIGKTGGSKDLQAHTHKTTVNHVGTSQDFDRSIAIYNATDLPYALYTAEGEAAIFPTGTTGTGHSGNLQPYKVFAIWVRTA